MDMSWFAISLTASVSSASWPATRAVSSRCVISMGEVYAGESKLETPRTLRTFWISEGSRVTNGLYRGLTVKNMEALWTGLYGQWTKPSLHVSVRP